MVIFKLTHAHKSLDSFCWITTYKINNSDVLSATALGTSVVDSSFQSIFYNDENDKSKRNDNRQALFAGNPVCHTDINLKNSFSCDKMCSKYCWYKKEEVDQSGGYCLSLIHI